MRIKAFMNEDFRQFSIYDNVRSIPNGIDGFKPSQRKVIYAMIKRGENAKEIKVVQHGSATALITAYKHGETSLCSTIVGLAQDYTGSNNLNFFSPNGSFGGRLNNEAAAARYIYTEFTPHFRKLYKKEDDSILPRQYDEGDEIEPQLFYPILPTILINGAEGMGTGYACKILKYNPSDIRDYVLARLNGKKPKDLVPWLRGFIGNIYRNADNDANPNQVIFEGKLEIKNTTTILISEIPPNVELADYKKHLLKLKETDFIQDWEDASVEDTFSFEVKVPRTTSAIPIEDLMIKFKLISRDSENVTVWDENNKIVEYKNVHELADAFVNMRTGIFEVRRLALIAEYTEDVRYMSEKLKFILYYLKHTKDFRDKKKAEIIEMMESNGFTDIGKLMSLSIWSLTHDELEKLEKEIGNVTGQIDFLKHDTAQQMFIREVKELKFYEDDSKSKSKAK